MKDKKSQSEVLMEIAEDAAPFQDLDGVAHVTVEVEGHNENHAIRSRAFRLWLLGKYYLEHGRPPSGQAMADALAAIESRAWLSGTRLKVWRRVAGKGEFIYLDLGDPEWRAVEIGPHGWTLVKNPPVAFCRSPGMLALPVPERGGKLEAIKGPLKVRDEDDFIGVVAILLGSLRPTGPYPPYVLVGEQGSCKSTRARLVRAMVDPNTVPLRSMPKDERDLFLCGKHGWMVTLDNLSRMPDWLSDSICRISTGGGSSTRMLYSDTDEVLIDVTRPVILTSIETVVTNGDLMDRVWLANLPAIKDKDRMTEAEVSRAFNKILPKALGALLSAVSTGLKNLELTKIDNPPRMADFATWVVACEPALPWEKGRFLEVYRANIKRAVATSLDADPVGSAILRLMGEKRNEWTGTASELLGDLETVTPERERKAGNWPKSAAALGRRIKTPAAFLRRVGFELGIERSGHSRTIKVTRISVTAVTADTTQSGSGFHDDSNVTAMTASGLTAVTPKPLRILKNDGNDGNDSKSRQLSVLESDGDEWDPERVWSETEGKKPDMEI